MAELFTNFATSTLASSVAAIDTTITVQTGDGALFPSPTGSDFFRCVLFKKSTGDTEIVVCTSRSSDVLTVTRAQESTTALALNAGDLVELRPTAAFFTSLSVTSVNIQENEFGYADDAGGADTYEATYSPAPVAHVKGSRFTFKAANTNTGASTFNPAPGTLSGVSIRKNGTSVLEAGDILSGQMVTVEHDGTYYQLSPTVQPSEVGADVVKAASISAMHTAMELQDTLVEQTHTAFTTAGTAPAFTLTPTPAITAYAAGQRYRVKFNAAGTTGSNTINVSSQGAKNLKQYAIDGSKVDAVITANLLTDIEYDGTDFVLFTKQQRAIVPVRQTVLSSAIDSSGYPSFISAGTGLACNLSATAVAVYMAFAAGFDAQGEVDYIAALTSDSSSYWSSLAASNTSFLYADRNTGTGALTAGSTRHPPQYDYSYDGTRCALLNFEGSDASTSMIDAYGNTWNASGNAQIDTAQFKFGASSLLLDGTGDYISSSSITSVSKEDGFTIHLWVRWNTLPTAGNGQQIFRAINAGTFGVIIELINTAGTTRLTTSLSSNGTSNDIASAATGSSTTWSTGTWYHIALTYDGATYRLYKDGVQDYSVASTSKICSITGFYVGATAAGAQGLNGWIDAFEILPYPLFTTATSFTPPAAARTVEGNFFSIPEMKMYTIDSASASAGTNPGMTAVQRLFVGEAVTGATSVTSVVNYALRGKYDSGSFAAATDVTYTKSHKIGGNAAYIDNKIMFRETAAHRWSVTEQATGNTRNTLYIRSGATNVGGGALFTTAGAQSTNPITSANWRVLSSRGF